MKMIKHFYKCCLMYKKKWKNVKQDFPSTLKQINNKEQRDNEIKLIDLEEKVKKHFDKFPLSVANRALWRKKGNLYFGKILEDENIFMINKMNKRMREGIFDTTKEFIKTAREFDESLSILDISQALRNVWIINILQETIEKKQKFSKAIFGYSMLYPYTDNFLDDNRIGNKEKNSFNVRFYKRLNGDNITPINNHEEKVFNLVNNIEDTFNRDKYKDLYNSLILIYKGQNKSLKQHKNKSITTEQLLDISVKKGGASVLVDGFMVNGNLSLDQIEFLTGYGFFLQLGDDIQDIKEDEENKHNTIACKESEKENLDNLANKLLNFVIELLDKYNWKDKNLKEVVLSNCINLVLFSIILNKEFYSKGYIEKVSKYIPFSIEFIENMKSKYREKELDKENERLMMLIDEIVL